MVAPILTRKIQLISRSPRSKAKALLTSRTKRGTFSIQAVCHIHLKGSCMDQVLAKQPLMEAEGPHLNIMTKKHLSSIDTLKN